MMDFLKKVNLDLKNADLYWYKGPRPKNVDLFTHDFWKIWAFMLDFLKKVDLGMKNMNLYLNMKMCIVTHHFLKKVDFNMKTWTF